MDETQYEVCLHHLTAVQCSAAWNHAPVRLEVYADGARQDHLTKFNGGCDTWDLSDTIYRFNDHISFHLLEQVAAGPAGSEHLRVLASFSVPGALTKTAGAQADDDSSGYRLGYTVYAVEHVKEPVVLWADAAAAPH